MTKNELKLALAKQLKVNEEDIAGDVLLNDLGFDSIQFISFIVAIEEEFNIDVLDSDLIYDNFSTIDKMHMTLSKYFESPVYKCLITDCDGVLWQGIAGESGLDEAYYSPSSIALSNILKKFRKRGVMLAICSKNTSKNIHEMLDSGATELSSDDFIIIDSDIHNKYDSITTIIADLGVLPESIIFIDDSDYEIGLISENLPDIRTIKATEGFIDELIIIFNSLSETAIDRTEQYRAQKERERTHRHTSTVYEYNSALNTEIICRKAELSDIPRMAELSQRANRFNINGKRYDEAEILNLLNNDLADLYIVKASDKYGDMGIVGMSVIKNSIIDSFILSCRVFDRGFEYALLDEIKKASKTTLYGQFIPTGKNDYCEDFLVKNNISSK